MVRIGNRGHEWKQSDWKMPRNELFIYIMTCVPSARGWQQGCHMCHPSFCWPTRKMIFSTQKQESWTTDSNLAGDLRRMKLLRMRWGSSIIQCSSFSVGLWTKLWRASACEWLYQCICFEAFLLVCITCFVFSWNETQTKPACHPHSSADEPLSHSMALSKQLAHSLSQLCLLKKRVMSYALLIMKKWTRMEQEWNCSQKVNY